MYGILCKEVDFDFMARCKANTFRKEIQSLLEMNAEHLDGSYGSYQFCWYEN